MCMTQWLYAYVAYPRCEDFPLKYAYVAYPYAYVAMRMSHTLMRMLLCVCRIPLCVRCYAYVAYPYECEASVLSIPYKSFIELFSPTFLVMYPLKSSKSKSSTVPPNSKITWSCKWSELCLMTSFNQSLKFTTLLIGVRNSEKHSSLAETLDLCRLKYSSNRSRSSGVLSSMVAFRFKEAPVEIFDVVSNTAFVSSFVIGLGLVFAFNDNFLVVEIDEAAD